MKNEKITFRWILPLFLAIALCIMMQDMVAFAAETGETGETTECKHIWDRGERTKEPTCISAGITEYTCVRCKEKKTEVIPVDPEAHNWTNEVTKEPTELTKGTYTSSCDLCNKKETYNLLLAKTGYYIYCPSQRSKTYATVYSDARLTNGFQSKIEEGTIIYTFEDSTTRATKFCYPIGTTETAYLSSSIVIIITDEYRAPDKVKLIKLRMGKKKMTISWQKDNIATGYQVTYATNAKFTKGRKKIKINNTKTSKKTIKKLKSKQKYYVKVQAYREANGEKIYGPYSLVKVGTVK